LPSEKTKDRARAIATSAADLLDHQVNLWEFVLEMFIVHLLLK
jgi:hypothetical protein